YIAPAAARDEPADLRPLRRGPGCRRDAPLAACGAADRMTVPVPVPATAGRPLAGLRVIEVASFVAGPLGGMTLAQLGAEVIRVDPPGGAPDTTRWPLAPGGGSLYWAGLNKGKRSVTADFRSADGQRAVAELVASSGPDGG